jgi:signal peptidase I
MSKSSTPKSAKGDDARPKRRDLKHARHMLKHGRKWLWVHRDVLAPQQIESCEAALARLQTELEGDTRPRLAAAMEDAEKQFRTVKPPSRFAGLRENFEAIFVALVIAGAVRTYFVQPFKIPTGSMEPTLFGNHVNNGKQVSGDRIFVDRFTCNFIRSERGDIIVFRTRNMPESYKRRGADFYIKRLVGIGGEQGETLQIKGGRLYIDQLPVNEPVVFQKLYQLKLYNSSDYRGYIALEDLGKLDPGKRVDRDEVVLYSANQTVAIKPRQLFVLGDNTSNSTDSRYWGTIPRSDVIGRAFLIYWPISARQGRIQ